MSTEVTVAIVAHGSSYDSSVVDDVNQLAARVREAAAIPPGVTVVTAFLKNEPRIEDLLTVTSTRRVVVFPLFMAQGWFADRVIPASLGLDVPVVYDRWHEVGDKEICYLQPLGAYDETIDLFRAELAPDGEAHLIVVGHGTPKDPNSRGTVTEVVERIERAGRWATVRQAFIDDEPNLADTFGSVDLQGGSVVVAPYFAANGPHVREDIPDALGVSVAPDGSFEDPGRPLRGVVLSAIGVHPGVADIIARSVSGALDQLG